MPRLLPDDHRISTNFSFREIWYSATAESNGWDNFPNAEELLMAHRHALLTLQPLRNKVGPLFVSSWLRKEQLNSALPGASPTSWHLTGLATDITSRQYSPKKLAMIIKHLDLPVEEVISESLISAKTGKLVEWCHVASCRPGEKARKVFKIASGSQSNPNYSIV